MCLAIPGKIIKIEKNNALIGYGAKKINAKIINGKYKIGDYVLVQNKIIMEKFNKLDAEEFLKKIK